MADATIRIKVDANTQEARVIKRELDDLGKTGDRAAKSTDKLAMSTKLLTGAIIGLGGALSLGQFAKLADTITNINTQLGNVTKSAGEFDRAFESLFKVAQNTGTEFTAVVDTFTRLNVSLPESLRQTTDLSKTVELLARGFAASGTEAQAARGAITQLTQGLASNFQASAQEINSLIDAAPLLAKVIAEELGGKAAVDLKRFAEEGTLTAESFLRALESAEASINAFAIPPTIEKAVIRLRNEFLLFASESDTLRIASEKLAGAINFLAGNLDNVFKIIGVALGAAIPALIVAFATSLPAAITATTAAFTALTAVIAANPFGAIAVAISATISALFLFRDEINETLKGVKVFGLDVGAILEDVATGAEIIFKSIGNSIGGFFAGTVNVIKAMIAKIKKEIFQLTDALANTAFGRRFGINPVNLFNGNAQELSLANGNLGDAFTSGFNGFSGFSLSQRSSNTLFNGVNINSVSGSANMAGGTNSPSTITNSVSGLTQELDKAKGKTEELDTAFGNLANDIERDLAGAFKDAFSAGTGFFGKFADGLKSTFKNAISEIAFQAAKPIFLNIVAGVTGGVAGGSASSALASSLGGSGGGIGSIGSIISAGRNLISGGSSQLLTQGLDRIGSIFGIGNGLQGPTLSGGTLGGLSQYSTLTNGSFGGSLGGAVGGLAGNFAANALFGGDRGIGANIGGTIGGIAGSFIPIPIVGTALGSFVGNAIGGLFGGKSVPSNAADISFVTSNGALSTGRVSSDEASSERLKQINTAGSSIVETVNNLVSAVGGTLNSTPNFRVGATRREPGLAVISGMRGQGQSGEFVFNNFQKAVDFALTNVLARADIGGLSDQFSEIFKSIFAKGGKFEDRAAEVLEAKALIDIIEGVDKKAVSPLKIALDELDSQFDNLRATASKLGLDVDNLNEAFEKQRTGIIQEALAPLQDFLDSQALSSTSSLSAVERLSLARSAFDENLSAINSGDLSGINNITGQASTLLSLGRDVFASGKGFNALESFVRQSITGIAGTLGAEGGLNDSVAREISLSNAQQTSILEQMNARIEELREENRKLRKSMERVGNAVVQMVS